MLCKCGGEICARLTAEIASSRLYSDGSPGQYFSYPCRCIVPALTFQSRCEPTFQPFFFALQPVVPFAAIRGVHLLTPNVISHQVRS